ncbi:MAG: DUF58 domain-containing protein [Nitrospirota bacterium]
MISALATPSSRHAGRLAAPAVDPPARRRAVRTAKVTPMGVAFLLLALAVGLAAVNTGNNVLYLLFAMMLSLIIVAGLFSERTLARLSASRSLPTRLFAGARTSCRVTLTNGKRWMPAFSLRLQEHGGRLDLEVQELRCPRLDPGATVTMDTTLTFRDRGLHALEGINVTTTFPFGLFEKTVRVSANAQALVYPTIGITPWSPGKPATDVGHAGRSRGTSGLSHVREYRVGDDPRYIHWKHSARRAKLVIREPEPEGARAHVIVFSNRLPPDPLPVHREWFEHAVRVAASLVERDLREGREVLLATWDGVTRTGRGAAQLERLLRTLATIGPSPSRPGDRLITWTEALPHQASHVVLAWDDPAWTRVRAACDRVWVASRLGPGERL